jgi:hypothetical protein
MANNTKSFDDREVSCKKCFAPVGREILDRQVLVIGALAFFNFARFACLNCEAINGWQAPNLMRGENESLDRRFPDKLSDLPKPEKRLVGRLGGSGVRGVSRVRSGKYKAQIAIGGGKTKYLGLFDSVEAAEKAYHRALLPENYHQKFSEDADKRNAQNEIKQNFSAS